MRKKAYVTNEKLLTEIRKYKETKKMSDELGKCILIIARRYATKPNYCGYTYIEDMISDAVLTVVKYLDNFDEKKSNNPFAYITQIVSNGFKASLNVEHGISKLKQSLWDDHAQDICRMEKFEQSHYREE